MLQIKWQLFGMAMFLLTEAWWALPASVAALGPKCLPARRCHTAWARAWQPTPVLKFCPVDQVCAHPLCPRQAVRASA